MDATPRSLLERLREPGEAASSAADWGRLVELFTPLLYAWACRLGLQEPDAADLVQNVFVVVFRKLPTFEHDGRGSFRAWLRTILLNQYRDRLRRPQAPTLTDPALLNHRAEDDPPEAFEDTDFHRQLAQRALRLMQQDFQPATWRACWETKVNGRSAAEVAAELHMSVPAVHAATSRVLRRLRQELQGFWQ